MYTERRLEERVQKQAEKRILSIREVEMIGWIGGVANNAKCPRIVLDQGGERKKTEGDSFFEEPRRRSSGAGWNA